MLPAEFELAISACESPPTHALDLAAIRLGS